VNRKTKLVFSKQAQTSLDEQCDRLARRQGWNEREKQTALQRAKIGFRDELGRLIAELDHDVRYTDFVPKTKVARLVELLRMFGIPQLGRRPARNVNFAFYTAKAMIRNKELTRQQAAKKFGISADRLRYDHPRRPTPDEEEQS
jgi:hypothetical protein